MLAWVCMPSMSIASEEVISLLMTEDEEKTYARKDEPKEKKEDSQKPAEPIMPQVKTYQLQAVVFHNLTQWTVWVDGKSYTAQQPKISSSMRIKALSGQSVEITDGSDTTLLFTGQSYQGRE
mgnify:CR=1 FL=1